MNPHQKVTRSESFLLDLPVTEMQTLICCYQLLPPLVDYVCFLKGQNEEIC